MEVYQSTVDSVAAHRLPWRETLVLPIGDVQLGAAGCDEDRLRRHVEWGIANNAYFIGLGDYVDIASPSNRDSLRATKMYDSVKTALDDSANALVERYLQLMAGSEGRWLGLLEGHHYWEFLDGTTTDTRIAMQLRAPFLGTCAFVRTRFADDSGHTIPCTFWCHHGAGSGQSTAAPLVRLERIVQGFEADVYLISHYSRKGVIPLNRLYMGEDGRIKDRKRLLVATGGFVKAYEQGSKVSSAHARGSYAEKAMYNPVALGGTVVYARPARDNSGNPRLDLGCEV